MAEQITKEAATSIMSWLPSVSSLWQNSVIGSAVLGTSACIQYTSSRFLGRNIPFYYSVPYITYVPKRKAKDYIQQAGAVASEFILQHRNSMSLVAGSLALLLFKFPIFLKSERERIASCLARRSLEYLGFQLERTTTNAGGSDQVSYSIAGRSKIARL